MSGYPRPPRPLLVINDKGGEKCRLKACCSVLHMLCLHKSGGTSFQILVAPVLVCLSQSQYPFCQANSVAPSFQNRWHRFWLLYATGPCNKLLLASIGLENLCYVCLNVCWTFLCWLRLICMLVWFYEWCIAFWQGCLGKTGGTEFGNTVAPSLARQHYIFLALCVGVLIYCMHHSLNVHTLVLHPTVAEI
jgi:hypothetical protein